MSLGARATNKGGAKGAGGKETKHNHQDKSKSAEKPPPKDKAKPQATTEQLRLANMIDRKTEEALEVRRMVLELMEMTCRSEEEVCSALHDCDNDMALACDLLLEGNQRIQGEWQTSEKKKKKSGGAAAGNGDAEQPAAGNPRSRSGPRQRRDGGGGGGEGAPRGRGGSGRGRGSARGGRAGGRGPGRPRPGGPRGRPNTQDPWPDSQDNNAYGTSGGAFPAAEDWDADDKYVTPAASAFPAAEDWDNEEWSGSLADSKMSQVFTPSQQPQPEPEPQSILDNSMSENWETSLSDAATNNGDARLNYTYHNSTHQMQAKAAEVVASRNMEHVSAPVSSVDMSPHAVSQAQQQQQQPIGLSGSLSAAQSQYLSRLTQQSQQHDNSVYTSNYGVYASSELATQRKPQRARVPPPSKIPSSAVEMPGGEPGQMGFIDVQFGALEPDTLTDPAPTLHQSTSKQVISQREPSPPMHPAHEPIPDSNSYPAPSMLSEPLVADPSGPPSSQPTPVDVSASSSLESRLTASMKQLSTAEATSAGAEATTAPATQPYATPYHHQQYTQRAAKHQSVGQQQQSMYATHHAVSHHPVYGANVYAPQVNSTNASLTGASAMTSAYPPSVTLSQYHTQPLNSYQQTSSSASVYGGSALYTAAAPYTAYQPTPSKLTSTKEASYDTSVSSQRSLTGASTTQAAAKVTTAAAAKVTSGSNASAAQYTVQAQPQPQAFYTQQQGQPGAAAAYAAAYAAEEAQMLRGTLPHHMVNNGGYYEVGYGVTGAREPTAGFGLGGGERFGRADASSPQQVAAALPPGYAYFFQPPPPQATYQPYGVYPYGGGSSVTGVGGVSGATGGKVATYSQQQPQYDTTQPQQDSYKQGAYSGGGKAGGAGAAAAELTSAMYAKAHASLNKVNSYEKAAFHSGTPPPFGGSAPHHLYIPAAPQHHNPHHHHQQQHQESSAGAARGAGAGKPAGNKSYSQSYWTPN